MKLPRILLAGTKSGCGKTTAVCAVLTLLRRRGVNVRSFKCGPDYIDPMFHSTVLGVPASNLDPFFCGGALMRRLLCENAEDALAVIEGVMGYYDGTGNCGTQNSTFTVAHETNTPVILVVDGKGAAASLLAVIEGFFRFQPHSGIKGVLFNRMKPQTYQSVCAWMRARFGGEVAPVGYIPEFPESCRVPSRHLGLITAGEIADLSERINAVADLCEATIETETILSLARAADDLAWEAPAALRLPPVCIAYAKDAAFCFFYSDTLRLFESMGAVLLPFSPLNNEPVPAAADGLLLGGGYPELYADRLEQNKTAKESVRRAVLGGMPTIAECGGFQYLGKTLDGKAMCGALSHESAPAGHLVRFGYCTLTAKADSLFGPAGTVLRGHEFHYWDSTQNGDGFICEKPSGKRWTCAVSTPTLYAGYPHLFLYAHPSAAQTFYQKCLDYREKKP